MKNAGYVEPIGNLKANMSYLVTLYTDKILVKDIFGKKSVELSTSILKLIKKTISD